MTMDSNEQQELDAIARLHAEKLELEREGYLLNKPGDTEAEALATVAPLAMFWGWVGTTLAGGALGTLMFPIVGTILGMLMAGIGGLLPSILAALLYALSRGRVSPKFAMAWAGAASGVGCFVGMMTAEIDWFFSIVAGLFGAVGARLATWLALRNYVFEEGLGKRSLRRFAIVDLMLLTVWLAVSLTAVQIVARLAEWTGTAILTSLAISLACACVVELFSQLGGALRSMR